MVPTGRIGDIFGRRRALLAGIALFGVASVFCAIAPSAAVVIAFRGVQGVGAAFIFPVSVSVVTNAFPPGKSSRAIGLSYGIAGLGNAAGLLVGGLLTQTVGWRAVFWLLVPLAAVSFLVGAKTIPESSDETVPRRLDLSGLALITSGIGLFTIAFDRAPSWGWLSAPTFGTVHSVRGCAGRVRRCRATGALAAGQPGVAAQFEVLHLGRRGHDREHRLYGDRVLVDHEPAAGAWAGPTYRGYRILGPSAGAALGGVISDVWPRAIHPSWSWESGARLLRYRLPSWRLRSSGWSTSPR